MRSFITESLQKLGQFSLFRRTEQEPVLDQRWAVAERLVELARQQSDPFSLAENGPNEPGAEVTVSMQGETPTLSIKWVSSNFELAAKLERHGLSFYQYRPTSSIPKSIIDDFKEYQNVSVLPNSMWASIDQGEISNINPPLENNLNTRSWSSFTLEKINAAVNRT